MNHATKIVRYAIPGESPRLGICKDDKIYEFTPMIQSFEALVQLAHHTHSETHLHQFVQTLKTTDTGLRYQDLDSAPDVTKPHLLMPLVPAEVWGAGVTYERSRMARTADEKATMGIYDKVYEAERPELFFKATAHRCVGPNVKCGIRSDSKWTVPEPELAVVVGGAGEILAYSLGNDMNARDIEGDNPLYLPQAKIHRACFSFGPALLLIDSLQPVQLSIFCHIIRAGMKIFHGEINTARLHRPIPVMIDYLRHTDAPAMTVLSTGTGIVPPNDIALKAGDVIEIGSDMIGVLRNEVIIV